MKSILVSLVVFLFASSLCSFEKGGLLYKPMPVLPNKTLDGKTIDADYFKGHVTVVTFMFIGCPPCMNEISVLNKLKKKYAGNEEVQILCIARQMRGQMEQFNFIDTSMFGKIRLALKVPRMEYAIQPACADAASKMEQSGDHVQIKPE